MLFTRLFTRFWKDRLGSAAPMVGIAIIPLMGAVGAAVDYSQANATRAAFQNALDSTALMLSKTAALQSAAALQGEATADFNALFSSPFAKNVAVTATLPRRTGATLRSS